MYERSLKVFPTFQHLWKNEHHKWATNLICDFMDMIGVIGAVLTLTCDISIIMAETVWSVNPVHIQSTRTETSGLSEHSQCDCGTQLTVNKGHWTLVAFKAWILWCVHILTNVPCLHRAIEQNICLKLLVLYVKEEHTGPLCGFALDYQQYYSQILLLSLQRNKNWRLGAVVSISNASVL